MAIEGYRVVDLSPGKDLAFGYPAELSISGDGGSLQKDVGCCFFGSIKSVF